MFKKLSVLFCLSIVIICLDQMSKYFIQTHFSLGESLPIIPQLFNFSHARNFGAAFGFLEQSPEIIRSGIMLSIPPLACLIILALVFYVKSFQIVQLTSLSAVFGGAVGNYLDRLNYGYVIDFIDLHWKQKYFFPTFNLADMAIVTGIFFLILTLIKEDRHEART